MDLLKFEKLPAVHRVVSASKVWPSVFPGVKTRLGNVGQAGAFEKQNPALSWGPASRGSAWHSVNYRSGNGGGEADSLKNPTRKSSETGCRAKI